MKMYLLSSWKIEEHPPHSEAGAGKSGVGEEAHYTEKMRLILFWLDRTEILDENGWEETLAEKMWDFWENVWVHFPSHTSIRA